jgi:hypothetical protein
MRFVKVVLLTGSMLAGLTAAAGAAPITPVYDSFGFFPATFGGSGIPNHAVASSTVLSAGPTFTIALTAHQRFVGPNLGNDGAGSFEAPVGESPPASGLALWNFAYYIGVSGVVDPTLYSVELLYDFDPGANTDDGDHGVIEVASFLTPSAPLQDSQNLGFSFLGTTTPPFLTAPAFPYFDPNVNGEYTFAIRVSEGSTFLGQTAIRVTSTPEPGTLALFGLGAIGMAAGRLRRKDKTESL